MSSPVEKAISSALEDHAKSERHIDRWTDALTTSLFNNVITHLGEKLFVSEQLRIRVATVTNELAVDFTDHMLPNMLEKAVPGARLERSNYAALLTNKLLGEVVEKYTAACVRALDPGIKKRIEAQDRAIASQPSDRYVEPVVNLGAYAADMQKRFAIEDARAAAPVAPAPSAFIDPDTDPGMVQRSGEATLAQSYNPHERGPAPSPMKVERTLDRARDQIDRTELDLEMSRPGGKTYPAKRKGR